MYGTGGYGSTAADAAEAEGAAPQVYHDALLAAQRPVQPTAQAGPRSSPPLVQPPIDPDLSSAARTSAAARARAAALAQAPAAPRSLAFPTACVFDGVGQDGRPLIDRRSLDPREAPALVAYLTGAPVVLSAPGTTADELVPDAPPDVPRVFHSDGAWIWPAAVGYYLSVHGLPPQAELLAHIRSRRYALGPVHPQAMQAAAAQILAEMNAQRTRPESAAAATRPASEVRPSTAGEPAASRPTPAPSVAPVARLAQFSPGFNAAGNRHAAWVTEQVEAFLGYLPLGDWTVDHATRVYRQADRQFLVDALGTLSPAGLWTWAWADAARWGDNPQLTAEARRLRAVGEREGIAEFVAPAFELTGIADAPESPQDAAEMLAWTAMGVLGARGYMGHSVDAGDQLDSGHQQSAGHGSGRFPDEGHAYAEVRAYYLVFDPVVPHARPQLSTVPRFLTEGVEAFGEDAVECVLGYVEHYGWDWSRVPDGIAVAAEGVGSFNVEISADGWLSGLTLHS